MSNPAEIEVEVSNEQSLLPRDARWEGAVEAVLRGEGLRHGAVSLAVVDDARIRVLNRSYLGHDYATDVLSFLLEHSGDSLEGEVIASAETALGAASRFGWTAADELLLYIVHGTLHLAGYDDQTPEDQATMRARERHYLAHFGLEARYE